MITVFGSKCYVVITSITGLQRTIDDDEWAKRQPGRMQSDADVNRTDGVHVQCSMICKHVDCDIVTCC